MALEAGVQGQSWHLLASGRGSHSDKATLVPWGAHLMTSSNPNCLRRALPSSAINLGDLVT